MSPKQRKGQRSQRRRVTKALKIKYERTCPFMDSTSSSQKQEDPTTPAEDDNTLDLFHLPQPPLLEFRASGYYNPIVRLLPILPYLSRLTSLKMNTNAMAWLPLDRISGACEHLEVLHLDSLRWWILDNPWSP